MRLLPIACLVACMAASAVPRSAYSAETAAPFTLKGLDGKPLKLSDYKGQPVVVDFWATWCAPCRASMPHLNLLQEHYQQQGLVVIGLSVDDESAPFVRRYADKLGVRFRMALASEDVLDDYGPIRSIPTTLFINRRGEIVRRVTGYIDAETMDGFAQEIVGK